MDVFVIEDLCRQSKRTTRLPLSHRASLFESWRTVMFRMLDFSYGGMAAWTISTPKTEAFLIGEAYLALSSTLLYQHYQAKASISLRQTIFLSIVLRQYATILLVQFFLSTRFKKGSGLHYTYNH
jgi:hypothetical protein